MQNVERTEGTTIADDLDWDRTTDRLTEEERMSRYEAHVEKLRREKAPTPLAEPS